MSSLTPAPAQNIPAEDRKSRLEQLPNEILHQIIMPYAPSQWHRSYWMRDMYQVADNAGATSKPFKERLQQMPENITRTLISCLLVSKRLYEVAYPLLFRHIQSKPNFPYTVFVKKIMAAPDLGKSVYSMLICNRESRHMGDVLHTDQHSLEHMDLSILPKELKRLFPSLRDLAVVGGEFDSFIIYDLLAEFPFARLHLHGCQLRKSMPVGILAASHTLTTLKLMGEESAVPNARQLLPCLPRIQYLDVGQTDIIVEDLARINPNARLVGVLLELCESIELSALVDSLTENVSFKDSLELCRGNFNWHMESSKTKHYRNLTKFLLKAPKTLKSLHVFDACRFGRKPIFLSGSLSAGGGTWIGRNLCNGYLRLLYDHERC